MEELHPLGGGVGGAETQPGAAELDKSKSALDRRMSTLMQRLSFDGWIEISTLSRYFTGVEPQDASIEIS